MIGQVVRLQYCRTTGEPLRVHGIRKATVVSRSRPVRDGYTIARLEWVWTSHKEDGSEKTHTDQSTFCAETGWEIGQKGNRRGWRITPEDRERLADWDMHIGAPGVSR